MKTTDEIFAEFHTGKMTIVEMFAALKIAQAAENAAFRKVHLWQKIEGGRSWFGTWRCKRCGCLKELYSYGGGKVGHNGHYEPMFGEQTRDQPLCWPVTPKGK